MILVTGGTGLLGSHLLLELAGKEEPVRAIRRSGSDTGRVRDLFGLYTGDPDPLFNKIEWVEADITDEFSLPEALRGVSRVFHAAADVSIRPGSGSGMFNNVQGTANVVNACQEHCIKKLCFVSSTSAIGTARYGKEVTEDLIWTYNRFRSAYSVSKYKSEMEVWRGIAEGLNAVIVNPSIIIGPGDWNRSSAYLFTAVWNGLKFYTRGITGYVDVRDVVKAMIRLMDGPFSGERYILSSQNLSYRDVLDGIAVALGKKKPGIYAGRMLSSMAWRGDWLLSGITGKPRSITRDAARSGRNIVRLSNRKIRDAIGMEFMPVDRSISETARIFLDQHTR